MPTLARPDVDVLDGLTTAIIVDQERMGADPRSTVGTATDANAMLRILFSRLGQPHIGSPQAFSFNVASVSGAGAITVERGREDREGAAQLQHHRRHVPALRGPGHGHRHRPDPALRRQQVAQRGRAHHPRLHRRAAGTRRLYSESGFFDPDKPIRKYTKKELHDFLHHEPVQDEDRRHQHDLRGADPADPEVDAVQGQGGDAAAHPGVRGPGGHLHRLPRLRRHPAQRGGPVVEDQGDQHRRRVRDADQRPGRVGPRPRRAVGGAAARRRCSRPSTRSSRSGWATSRSTGRRARCRAARRSAPR